MALRTPGGPAEFLARQLTRALLLLLLLPGFARPEGGQAPLVASTPSFGTRLDLSLPLTVAPLSGMPQLRFGGADRGFALRGGQGLTRFELVAGTALKGTMFTMALLGLFAPDALPSPFRGKGRPPPLTGIDQGPSLFRLQDP
ncbi:MAG: hypothetical protein WC728_18840 [Elusimicrobiota bacterium]